MRAALSELYFYVIFHCKFHKFGNGSWKGGKKVGELGVVLCNGRVANGKLGCYLTEPHSRIRLVLY